MIKLSAKARTENKTSDEIRERGGVPAVLYGPKIKNRSVEVDLKEFLKVLKEAGESSLISLQLGADNFSVFIHEVKLNPVTDLPIHIDFYQPVLTEETEVSVPLVFEGLAPAVKDLGGTLVKEIQEVRVKGLPQNIPHEIKLSVEVLKTFDDEILVKDLVAPSGVKILRETGEIVALVVPPTKVEEELAKPIEEMVEEVEKAEKKEKPEEEGEVKEEALEKPEEKTQKKEGKKP